MYIELFFDIIAAYSCNIIIFLIFYIGNSLCGDFSMVLPKFQLYFKAGEKQLARQVFDRARSIDPGLALPWASMSAESCVRYLSCVIYLDIIM